MNSIINWGILCYLLAICVTGIFADRIELHSNHNKQAALVGGPTQSHFSKDANTSEAWCHTDPQVINHSLTWTISNFSLSMGWIGKFINSSTFPADSSTKSRWKLMLQSSGRRYHDHEDLSIYLGWSEPVTSKLHFRAKVSIINDKHQLVERRSGGYAVPFEVNKFTGSHELIHRFELFSDKAKLMPDDKLTIQFDLYEYGETKQYCGHVFRAPVRGPTPPDDFGHLLNSDGELSDVTFVVAGRREFKAHKAILGARSPVFKATFSSQDTHHQISRLEVDDIEPEVFEVLLRYIYTGRFELKDKQADKQHQLAVELSKAAAKYQLDELRSICEHLLG